MWEQSVGAIIDRPTEQVPLSKIGVVVAQAIANIETVYSGITVEKYVIMPNHVHMLLLFEQYDILNVPQSGRSLIAPTTLFNVVRQLKGYITKQIGMNIWQRGFYDHVVRNQADFNRIWNYIDENPIKWQTDCYYSREG